MLGYRLVSLFSTFSALHQALPLPSASPLLWAFRHPWAPQRAWGNRRIEYYRIMSVRVTLQSGAWRTHTNSSNAMPLSFDLGVNETVAYSRNKRRQ